MAKNSQMRKLLLCAGIILVVLFFWGVFKMKEGFSLGCSSRTNKINCLSTSVCAWDEATSKCSLTAQCSSLSKIICDKNKDVCTWTGLPKSGSCGNKS